MKIGNFGIEELKCGKHNIKDERLDQVHNITKSKKETYIQVEVVDEAGFPEADAILAPKDSCADLILKDLEFVETRLSRCEEEIEKQVLNKFKAALEKEQLVSTVALSEQEKQTISSYNLLTAKSIVAIEKPELENLNKVLSRAVAESGFISFFTTGEKETRAWLIKKGTCAREAAGAIHSDIEKGFIRAEIISLNDFLQAGGESQAKQAGKLHSEQKDYVMQDGDLTNFRFNK